MKILYVSQYYSPEVGAAAARVSELAGAWAKAGHEVTVLTAFSQHPVGVKAPGDRGVFFRREKDGGVTLLRCYIWATPNAGNLKRMIMFLSFALSATLLGSRKADRPDVVVATSPQLLTGLTGWYLSRKFKVPFVFEVRDLWPASIIAVNAMEDNILIRGLKKLSAFLYAQSALIVTVGEGYKRRLMELYGVRDKKIFVIPNGVETKLWKPGPRRNALRRKLGWGNDFVVLYLGTIGMAHALHRLVQAAGLLKHRTDIRIVIVGEGADKKNVRELDHGPGASQYPGTGFGPQGKGAPSIIPPVTWAWCTCGILPCSRKYSPPRCSSTWPWSARSSQPLVETPTDW